MSNIPTRNSASLSARLSALMLVAGALAPPAFAEDTKPAQQREQATAQKEDCDKEKAKDQAKVQAANKACEAEPASATTERKRPANPCAPAPRKKKARNPCA